MNTIYRVQVWIEGHWRWGLHDYTKEQAEARVIELAAVGIKCRIKPVEELLK